MSNQYQIFFGRNIPNSEETVSFQSFKSFLNTVVDPVFECYTLSNSFGVWNGEFEETFIITILTDSDVSIFVREISEEYKKQYNQESVLYTVTEAKMNFI